MDRRTVIKALMGGLAFPVVPIQIEAAAKKLNRRIILIELQGANDGSILSFLYGSKLQKLRPKIHLKKMKLYQLKMILPLIIPWEIWLIYGTQEN